MLTCFFKECVAFGGWMTPTNTKNYPKCSKLVPSVAKVLQKLSQWCTGGAKVPPKHLKWSPAGHLGRPWGDLGASWYLQKALKWSPEGHFGHPWGGLGAFWGHLRPDICFLTGFRLLFESFLGPKMSHKLIKMMSKTEVKNNTKINHNFHEKLMELMCQNV